MSNWLYQVRLKLSQGLSDDLRKNQPSIRADELRKIASSHNMTLVCTFDAFQEYCNEAEQNGIQSYPLYEWTKAVIKDPIKQQKHTKSFAFYLGIEQVYEKNIAAAIQQEIEAIKENKDILEVKLIDTNPAKNPQPPQTSVAD
ncbi:MAG: hypothetical protein RMX55_05300 [Planktomarina sp.]|nr:hypothetical protein [Planktomarina sp.]